MSTNSSNFVWTDSAVAPRAQRISPADWEVHRARIVDMHERGMSKQEICDCMSRGHEFNATLNQYTTQFDKWKLKRYKKSGKLSSDPASMATLRPDTTFEAESNSGETQDDITEVKEDTLAEAIPHSPLSDVFAISESLPPNGPSSAAFSGEHLRTMASSAEEVFEQPGPVCTADLQVPAMTETPFETSLPLQEAASTRAGFNEDTASDTVSVRTAASSSEARELHGTDDRISQQGDPGMVALSNPLMDNLTGSITQLSLQDPFQDGVSDVHSSKHSCLDENSTDSNSMWESNASQSQISLLTNRGSHITALTDQSKAVPHKQYFDKLYPRRKLKCLRKYVDESLTLSNSERILRTILEQADFFRVSLLMSDAFDLYLLVYLLSSDPKIVESWWIGSNVRLQAISGCAESAQNLSQVKLCQHILLELTPNSDKNFLLATGFPMKYLQGHLAALERRSSYAATCIQQAAWEVGGLQFGASAAVTSMLVHELVSRYRHMNLPFDPDSRWLTDAQKRLDSGEFPATMAVAIRTLLKWCISILVEEKVDATAEDCFSAFPLACITNAKGDKTPQDNVLMVVHFICMWGEETEASTASTTPVFPPTQANDDCGPSTTSIESISVTSNDHIGSYSTLMDRASLASHRGQKNARQGTHAIELISREIEIPLMSVFTTLSRMISESSLPWSASSAPRQETGKVARLRANATHLTQLSGEDLEIAFTKAYFFVNARAPELGYGLHPQRYLRALAVEKLPRSLVDSGAGPDWIEDTVSSAAAAAKAASEKPKTTAPQSTRSCSIRSSTSSARRLLLYDPLTSTLPQPSPRSSLSIRIRDAISHAVTPKRKYQPSIISNQSAVSRRFPPAKSVKRGSTGGASGSDVVWVEPKDQDDDFMLHLDVSMTSLNLGGRQCV